MRAMPDILGPERGLTIRVIHLESPGEIKVDLGVAEVVKEIKELIRWLADGRTADKLEILERKVGLLRQLGYSNEEIRRLIQKGERELDILLGLVRDKKLIPKESTVTEEIE